MNDTEQFSLDVEFELEEDLKIDPANVLGEIGRQKDLFYKWSTRLSKLENTFEKLCLQLDVLLKEKHIFYSTAFERTLNAFEVKIYVSGDEGVVKLKNKKRQLDTVMKVIRGGITSLKIKGKTLNMMMEQQKLNSFS
jgi:hypothetical protein